MAEISRNLGNSPAVIDQGVRQRQRAVRQSENNVELRRESQRVIEQSDSMLARERYELAKLQADLLAKQLFEAKIRESLAEEKVAAKQEAKKIQTDATEIEVVMEDAPVARKNRRMEQMVEELTALQNDMPVRNEPLFVNLTV